jgi:hypothetical protein
MTEKNITPTQLRKWHAIIIANKQKLKTTEQSHELKNKHTHANLIFMKSPNCFNRW